MANHLDSNIQTIDQATKVAELFLQSNHMVGDDHKHTPTDRKVAGLMIEKTSDGEFIRVCAALPNTWHSVNSIRLGDDNKVYITTESRDTVRGSFDTVVEVVEYLNGQAQTNYDRNGVRGSTWEVLA